VEAEGKEFLCRNVLHKNAEENAKNTDRKSVKFNLNLAFLNANLTRQNAKKFFCGQKSAFFEGVFCAFFC